MLYKSIAMRESKDLPFVKNIYFGAMPQYWAYQSKVDPVAFHVTDGDKLVVVGAHTANSLSGGLYLDCAPVAQGISPVMEV